jgi:hypothetical protein
VRNNLRRVDSDQQSRSDLSLQSLALVQGTGSDLADASGKVCGQPVLSYIGAALLRSLCACSSLLFGRLAPTQRTQSQGAQSQTRHGRNDARVESHSRLCWCLVVIAEWPLVLDAVWEPVRRLLQRLLRMVDLSRFRHLSLRSTERRNLDTATLTIST